MNNPIHDRIGGKYYRRGSTRYWFYGFTSVIILLWILALLDNSTSEPLLFFVFTSICASSAVLGILAMFAAPFASQVVSQMRKHEAYELIQITTLTRQQILRGLLSGMLTHFRRGVGFALLTLTIVGVIGILFVFLVDDVLWIMLMPVLGMVGLCYLGLMGGIASGFLLKNTVGANILASASHFVVVTVWFLFAYMIMLSASFFYADDFYQPDKTNLIWVAIATTIAPYILALIPLVISYGMVRRT
ncbi:MAG: hypothetical protein L0154_07900 [Chloroflexi bacterium]|nr:hypothetical protein [Chloroflexota bacterium]